MKKLKKGLSYISERTNQFRYSDKENIEKWLQPLSEYIPLVKIKRGQPVSVATKKDLEDIETKLNLNKGTLVESSNSYITLTNPSKHSHSIGLAYEYSDGVTEDNILPDMIHVLGNGKFLIDPDYLIKSHQLEESQFSLISETEYIPSFLENYSENIGKSIYCKGNTEGELTIIPEEAYLAYNNIIKIGFITDAWLNTPENNIKNCPAAIEVQIDGDDRGILDATSFEAILGESVKIPQSEDVCVFAIGQDEDRKFEFTLGYQAPEEDSIISGFIGLQRLDGKTSLIYINKENKTNHNIEDTAFIEVGKIFDDVTIKELNLSKLSKTNIDDFWGKLETSLNESINEISYLPEDVNGLKDLPDFKGNKNYEKITGFNVKINQSSQYSRIKEFKANQIGGHYTIYISSELKKYFQFFSIQNHGSYYNKGYAVLADIRNPSRQNLIGFYNSGKKILKKGQSAIFLKQGLFRTHKEYEPGKVYYLSNNGKINPIPQEYFNSVIKICVAQTKNQLIVDCNDARQYPDGDIPVGYMKPSVNGEAEFGFVLMDGKTALDKNKYFALFKRCKQWFTEAELKVQNYDFNSDGIADGEPLEDSTKYNAEGFVLPLIEYQKSVKNKNDTGYIPAQIKYLNEGVFKEFPKREPFIRKVFDECEEKNGVAIIPQIDITSLIIYGPESDLVYFPELETLDIKLFADLRGIPNATDREWTEIKSGFHEFNNMEYYGFEWRIKKEQEPSLEYPMGKYILYTVNSPNDNDTNALGPRYQKTPYSPPESIAGRPLKIFVAKRDYWTRQFDVEALFQNHVKETVLDLKGKPWAGSSISGQALRNDIKTKVDTNRLFISNQENFDNTSSEAGIVEGYIKNLNFIFKTPEEEKDISSKINGSVRLYDENNRNIVLDYYKGFLKYSKINSQLSDDSNVIDASNLKTNLKKDTWNLIPYQLLKEHEDLDISESPHGIKNVGFGGNINAHSLQSVHLGRPGAIFNQNSSDNNSGSSEATLYGNHTRIIPYLKKYGEKNQYEFVIGNKLVRQSIKNVNEIPNNAIDILTEEIDNNGNLKKIYKNTENGTVSTTIITNSTDNNQIKITYDTINGNIKFENKDGFVKLNDQASSSSRDYKKIVTELKDAQFSTDWEDDFFEIDSSEEKDRVVENLKNSALQAISVLPLAVFKYNNENSNLKRWFGLITERVSEAKEKLKQDTENELGTQVSIKDENFVKDILINGGFYKFTEDEKKSIIEYLNFLTTNNDKSQNILSSIGVLFEAAKETQQRLLAVEMSTFGKDSPTLPGEKEAPEHLPDYVTNLPTLLGLNRLIKALCAEVFQHADPDQLSLEVSNGKSLHNYSRLDRIDQEINGQNAITVGQTDETIIHHLDTSCKTYPTEDNILKNNVKTTSREDAYEVQKNIVNDGHNFITDEPFISDKTDKSEYTTNKELGIDKSTEKFDGINEAINRIAYKLNILTTYINGEDNILARPQLLDKIRDNIETIIQELFDAQYIDNGEKNTPSFYKNKISRLDAATTKLYDFAFNLNGEKNINENGSEVSNITDVDIDPNKNNYNISKRIFNNKKIKGKIENSEGLLTSIRSASPESVDDYNYATIIDILIDLIGKTEDNILRHNGLITEVTAVNENNKSSFRNQESLIERIEQIEKALDMIALRFRNINHLENDNKQRVSNDISYTNISNIDDFFDWISSYYGIKIDKNKSFLQEPSTDITTFETYLNTLDNTKLHNAVYDIASRLVAAESNIEALLKPFGTRYEITKADSTLIKKNKLNKTLSNNSTLDAIYNKGYNLTKDLNNILKLLFGVDSYTKDGDYNTSIDDTILNDNFDNTSLSDTPLEKLFEELYNLPKRYNNNEYSINDTFTNDLDHKNTTQYDIEKPGDGYYTLFDKAEANVNKSILSNGNRNDFIKRNVYGKTSEGEQDLTSNDGDGKRIRKNRFEVIEEAIIAIRKFIGMTNMKKEDNCYFDGQCKIITDTNAKIGIKVFIEG